MRTARTAISSQPPLDLDVLREVVLYAIGDTARAPHLASVDLALRRVIEEIDALQPTAQREAPVQFTRARFLPSAAGTTTPAAAAQPANRPGDDATRPQRHSRPPRRSFGDRSFLQQTISDYFRSRKH
ncbi:MAG: hypothetical protein ABL908_11325 [Hyphomicrobium sp.]